MTEEPGSKEQQPIPEGFTFENEYSFINRLRSLNFSIDVREHLAATALELVLEVASAQTTANNAEPEPDPVLEFTAGTGDEPGKRALKVVPDAAGILFTDDQGNIARLMPPPTPSVLVFNEGRPEWFPIPDAECDYLLGLDGEGKWKWYEQLEIIRSVKA